MAQYFSPGVYIEEVETGPVPIQGVATNITGAVGMTVRGPTSGKPVLVTSFNDFQNTFGGFLPVPPADVVATWGNKKDLDKGAWWLFPLAVKGYFDNGGQQLYVKRVFSSGAKAAWAALGQGLFSEITRDAKATDTSLTLRHLFGISNTTTLNINAGGVILTTGGAPTSFSVQSYNPTSLVVGINNPPGIPLSSATDFVWVGQAPAAITTSNTTLTFTAQDRGDWGNSLSVRVRPVLGATTTVAPDATLRQPPFVSKIVTAVGKWTVTLVVSGAGAIDATKPVTIGGTDFPVTAGAKANEFTIDPVPIATGVGWQPGTTQFNQGTTLSGTLTAAVPVSWTVTLADPATALKKDNHVLIGGDEVVLAADGTGSTISIVPDTTKGGSWAAGTSVQKMRPARTGGSVIDVADGSQLYPTALVELDNGTKKDYLCVVSVDVNAVTLSAAPKQLYFEGHRVRVIEAEVAVRVKAPDGSFSIPETFSRLRLSPGGGPSYLVTVVNTQSALVNVSTGPGFLNASNVFDDLTHFPAAPTGGWVSLNGGIDALGSLSVDDFVGVDGGSGNRTGIQALEDIDNISLCVVPGMWSTTVQSALVNLCETLKDRFAILDPPDGVDIAGIQAFRQPFDTKYAALYYPWLVVRDPSVRQNVHVAPSAHMAGLYARVDVARGVFKAPANETVNVINGFAQDINQREQDVLNPIGINALRFFPNRGNRVWGARTLSSDTTWIYINVRRIFIYVEKSIQVGTQWVVFEPNDEGTWSRVRQTVTDFLTTFWRNGGLQGTTAKEAFFVACGLGVTMSQDDINNGRLIIQVGIAPVKPAEFVIFQIQQYVQNTSTS
jgi:phage tail sheath protein FI